MRKKIFSLLIPGLTAMSWEGCPMAQVYSTELKTTEFKTIMGEEIELPVNIDIPISFEQDKALLEFQIENGQLQYLPFVSGTKVLKYKPTQIGVSSDLTLQVNNLLDPSLKQTHTFKVTTERAAFRATGRVDMLGNITIDMFALQQEHEEVLSKRQFQIVLAPNAFTNAVGKVLYNNHPVSGHDRLGITEVRSALKVADLGFLKQNILQPQAQANLPKLTFVIIDRKDEDNKRHVSIDLTPMVSAKIDKQVTDCNLRSREIEGELLKLNAQVAHPACFANLNEFALFKNQVLNFEISNNKLVETTLKLQSTYGSLENTQDDIDTSQAINRLVSEDNVRRQQLLKPLLELVRTSEELTRTNAALPNFCNLAANVGSLAFRTHVNSGNHPEKAGLRYYLLFKDAELQTRNLTKISKFQPLMEAASEGDYYTIKTLLAHPDIDVNATNKYGETALHMACWQFSPKSAQKGDTDYLEAIRLLLNHKDIQVNKLSTDDAYSALDALYDNQKQEKAMDNKAFDEAKELLISKGAKYYKYKTIWDVITMQ